MAEVQYLNPPEMRQPVGWFTQVVKVGNTLYIAGQTANDKNGNVVGINDIQAQTRQVYENIMTAVRAVGGSSAKVVRTRTYLTDSRFIPEYRVIPREFFPENPPANTMLIVQGLARPEYLIEVDAEAVIGD